MGSRMTYLSGMFCWVELGTTDPAGAADFYRSVLGWDIHEMEIPGSTYRTGLVDGDTAAGIYDSQGAPPAWVSYVAVDDVDLSSKKAEDLGATIIVEPADAGTMGRMTVIQDPGGAVVGLWKGNEMAGAQIVNAPGAFCLTQLNTQSPQEASDFYGHVFDWNFRIQDGSGASYWGIFVEDELNAGLMKNPSPGPDNWLVYFTTPSPLENACEAIRNGDGNVLVEPMRIPSGRIAIGQDPQGATFALFEGEVDD